MIYTSSGRIQTPTRSEEVKSMRYNFDLSEPRDDDDDGGRQSETPSSASTPKEELEWLPLQHHPVFSAPDGDSSTFKIPKNLLAWDGASRLYFWDSYKSCLHRLSVRLGEPDPTSVLAASPSKVLQADVQLNFEVQRISINSNGSALFLVGLDGGQAREACSKRFVISYALQFDDGSQGGPSLHPANAGFFVYQAALPRTVLIGSEIYFDRNNAIRTLKVCWHPYSDTHLGILSSDSVFRCMFLSFISAAGITKSLVTDIEIPLESAA
ncbi:hypothetical protein HAX54_053077 [Datura stramonium]|uniref:Uncharacterized protein n=1 Tax=Datura stramonium TaxID=4076 RepID=A0ABS8T0G5_DATST|nr:hypothetical protein [Datura stramonium]